MLVSALAAAAFVPSVAGAAPGDRDPAFGGRGVVSVPAFSSLTYTAVDAKGRILIGGELARGGGPAVGRLLTNGALDPTFGVDGVSSAGMASTEDVTDVYAERAGRILVGVAEGGIQGVVALNGSGALDSSFAGSGRFSSPRFYGASELAAAPGGGTFVFGYVRDGGPGVARLLSDGSLDTSYGDSGFGSVPTGAKQTAMVPLADGSVIIGATRFMKLDPTGHRDLSFGEYGGYATYTAIDGGNTYSMTATPNGTVFAGVGLCQQVTDTSCPAYVARTDGEGVFPKLVAAGSLVAGLNDNSVLVAGPADPFGDQLTGVVQRVLASGRTLEAFGLEGAALIFDGYRSVDVTDADQAGATYAVVASVDNRAPIVASLLLKSGGRADADADGLRDADDTCDLGFAKVPSGCPRAKRQMTIESTGIGIFVEVQTPVQTCRDRSRIHVFRKSQGRDQLVKTVRMVGDASLSTRGIGLKEAGRYYAALDVEASLLGQCSAARTRAVHVSATN